MLEAMISHYTNGNKAKFSTLLSVSAQTISAWIARNTFDAELIYTKCSRISADWLLSGEGPMLCADAEPTLSATPSTDTPVASDTVVLRLMEKIDEKDAKIDHLQSELRQKSEELAALKAKYPEAEIEHPKGLDHAKTASIKKPSSPNVDSATSATAQ